MLHKGFILSAVFDADGGRLYSGSVEGVVNVWDVRSAALLDSRHCHEGPVLDIRRSAGTLFTASKDRTAAVWDADEGTLIQRLADHGSGVFSADGAGALVATGCYDGRIRLWERDTGKQSATLTGHQDAVTNLAFLSEDRLVSGSRDRSVKVWDLRALRCAHTLAHHRHWVTKIRALGDGCRAASVGEDGICNLWDCEQGRLITSRMIAEHPIWGFDVAASGEFAVAGGASSATRIDLGSHELRSIPRTADRAGRAIAISPDGRVAALGSDDGNIALYGVEKDELVCTLHGANAGALSAAGGPDGCVATGHMDGAILFHSKSGATTVRDRAHARFVYTLCRVGENGLASGAFDGMVRVWSFATRELLQTLNHGGLIFSVSATPDGRQLLSAGMDVIRLWDLQTGTTTAEMESIGSGVHTVADLAGDARLIVSAGDDDLIRCWTSAGEPAKRFRLENDTTSAVKLLPDGRRAVVGDAYGRVSVVDLSTGVARRLHAHHEDWIRSMHASADGRFIVSVSQDCDCCIYDLGTDRLVTPQALRTPISAAGYDSDARVAAFTADGDIIRVDPGA